MVTYIIRRTLLSIPILFGITILSFAIMKAAPGDPMSLMMDPTISAADREAFIDKYGLNDPEYVQYMKWLGNMLQGDFGTSIVKRNARVGFDFCPVAKYPHPHDLFYISCPDHCHPIWCSFSKTSVYKT